MTIVRFQMPWEIQGITFSVGNSVELVYPETIEEAQEMSEVTVGFEHDEVYHQDVVPTIALNLTGSMR